MPNENIPEEEILGYWIEGELVCKECYDPLTMGDVGVQDHFSRWSIDPDILYLCAVCRQRIV